MKGDAVTPKHEKLFFVFEKITQKGDGVTPKHEKLFSIFVKKAKKVTLGDAYKVVPVTSMSLYTTMLRVNEVTGDPL